MAKFKRATLIDRHGKKLALVHGQIWHRREHGRLLDWGGSLWPEDGPVSIPGGLLTLRLADGRDAEIIVNQVRLADGARDDDVETATFLGTGSPP